MLPHRRRTPARAPLLNRSRPAKRACPTVARVVGPDGAAGKDSVALGALVRVKASLPSGLPGTRNALSAIRSSKAFE
jgi:hypothetical protein